MLTWPRNAGQVELSPSSEVSLSNALLLSILREYDRRSYMPETIDLLGNIFVAGSGSKFNHFDVVGP